MKPVLQKFEAYLLTEKCVSENTYHAYMRDIKQLCNYASKRSLAFDNLGIESLKQFLAYLKKKQCTPRSMARKISSMKVFYHWAHDNLGWQNYAAELTAPKLEKKLPQFLSEKEIEQLFAIARKDTSDLGKRNAAMLTLLYAAGLRISELTHMTVSRTDFDNNTVLIEGKGGRGRVVPLPDHMVAMLKDYLATVHKKFMANYGPTDYLFPVMYAGAIKPITRQSFWNVLKGYVAQSDIQRSVSPHHLRHSLATHMLKNGADLRSLQMLLGHEHVSTVQIYTHLETSHLRKEYDKKHPRS